MNDKPYQERHMADPFTWLAIASYLTRIIPSLPRVGQSLSSIFLGEAEKQNPIKINSDNFKKAEHIYFQQKLILDQKLLDLEKQKQSIERNNEAQRVKLQEFELELRAEISAKRLELMKEFQLENVASKLTEIKLDWDSRNNWFSKINRFESEQILDKYANRLLIFTSPPQISKDTEMNSFQDLDFELEMRSLEDFIHKNYSLRNDLHPVKYFSNFFTGSIGQIEIEQLHHLLNRFSTFIVYSDITAKQVTFRVAYWSINEQLEFFPEPLKWSWRDTRDKFISDGQSETETIAKIRDLFVKIYQILIASCIDFYYLSVDPFYCPRIPNLDQDADMESAFKIKLTEILKELQSNNYIHYIHSLQTARKTMNNNQRDQASKILKTLQNFFSDRPEVLRLLDPVNLDPDRVSGEVILESYRNADGFASPINFYATGKTRAGKSSLGNTLFDGNQIAIKSTGRRDCTDALGFFPYANNLRYFDLPGAGSNQEFENVNRAILCMDPLQPRRKQQRKGMNPEISEFRIHDYTNYAKTNKFTEKTVLVSEWQSTESQLKYGADIILYVIAPHEGIGRDDEDYLEDLLLAQKEKRNASNIIFALNLHLTSNGEPIYKQQNLDDVFSHINNIYYSVFPGQHAQPVIIEINSLTGLGADKITEQICNLLPADKLGRMEEVLGNQLKEKARSMRSKKFRQALIYIASRLALIKVDQYFDQQSDIVLGAYAAIYSYSLRVFQREMANGQSAYDIVSNIAGQTKESRTENKKENIPIIEMIERFQTLVEPVFEEKEELTQLLIEKEELKDIKRKSFWGVSQFLLGSKTQVVKNPTVIDLKSNKIVQTGTKHKQISDGHHPSITGYKEVVVSQHHLQGGYNIIQGVSRSP
jgi:hypothetical protein